MKRMAAVFGPGHIFVVHAVFINDKTQLIISVLAAFDCLCTTRIGYWNTGTLNLNSTNRTRFPDTTTRTTATITRRLL